MYFNPDFLNNLLGDFRLVQKLKFPTEFYTYGPLLLFGFT
jgi:hypothetical protein